MYFPDLTELHLPGFEHFSQLVAIGWLESGHEFPRGDVNRQFVHKLADLLINPWQPATAMGRHSCGFCRLTGGPSSFRLDDAAYASEVSMGISNLWLPADGFLYVAPSLILHYMDAHGYVPPGEFQAAVMACPTMRSINYLKALLKNGPNGLYRP